MAKSLTEKTVKGSLWMALDRYVTFGFRFTATLILVRLVGPAEYGLFALAFSYTLFFQTLSSWSFWQAVVQSDENDSKIGDTAVRITVVVNFILFVLSIPVGMIIASYKGLSVGIAFILLGLGYNFAALRLAFQAELMRSLRIRPISVIRVLAAAFSFAIAISLAFLNFGIYAIVALDVASPIFVCAVFILMRHRWNIPLGLTYDKESAKRVWSFGKNLIVIRAIERMLKGVDRLLLGHIVSPEVLGYYHQARYLADLPQGAVNSGNTHVAVVAFSKVKNEPDRLSRAFDTLQFVVARFMGIMAIVTILWPEVLLSLLYGDQWLPSADFLRILSLYIVLYPMSETYRSLMTALEQWKKIKVALILQLSLVFLGSIILGYFYGPHGASVSIVVAVAMGVLYLRICSKAAIKGAHGGAWAASLSFVLTVVAGLLYRTYGGPIDAFYEKLLVLIGTVVAYCLANLAVDRKVLISRILLVWNAIQQRRKKKGR